MSPPSPGTNSRSTEIPPVQSRDFRIDECGDSGILVTFLGPGVHTRWEGARAMAWKLTEAAPPGMVDLLASFDTLFVAFDPVLTDHGEIARAALAPAMSKAPVAKKSTHVLSVLFGGADGPELISVGEELGMSPTKVIDLYCESEWTVRVIGSPLGSPLMDRDDLPARIPSVSRLRSPRTQLPAGSLGASGHQTVLYPFAAPGGWQLIGRTETSFVDIDDGPRIMMPGDLVRFEPVSRLE